MHIKQARAALQCDTLYGLLQRTAELFPEAPAILGVQQRPLSYEALLRHVEETVRALNALGITRGDRVAMVLPNGPEAATCFLSVTATATSAPLNPAYSVAEMEFFLRDLAPKAIIVDVPNGSPAVTVARALGISVLQLIPLVKESAGLFRLEGGKPAEREGDLVLAEPGDIALVLHTSGTTARPKIVPLNHRNICGSAKNIAASLSLTSQDRCLNVMPLFHIHGLVGAMLASLCIGASVVCTPGFNALHFFEWLAEFQPTWYTAVPTMHQGILGHAGRSGGNVSESSLRFIRSCSSALPPAVMRELESVFAVPVVEAYGMTEASHQMAINSLPPGVRKPGSVGLPSGCEIGIMDDQGAMLPAEQVGHVVIRGPSITAGYADNPEANAKSFVHGWFHTGDQGRLDEDGYLFLTGRTREIINRGGEKISPREIDELLLQHPAVREAVAFAIPDALLGEDVAAAIVLKGQAAGVNAGSMEAELQEFVAGRLAAFKVPRRIVIVTVLPKGPTGKLQRNRLAEALMSQLSPAPEPVERPRLAPRNPTEESLAAIWKTALKTDIGIHDDFFRLGGDSAFGAQVISRIGQQFGIAVPMFRLFRTPTIAGLGEWLDAELKSGTRNFRPLERLPRPERLPLSFAQQRLWVLTQMKDASKAYHTHLSFHLKGNLHAAALRRALDRIMARHEVLRTGFVIVDGEPVQRIAPVEKSSFLLLEHNIESPSGDPADAQQELNRLAVEEASAPFNLKTGPVIRGRLIRQAENEHTLLITMHHIVSDGWSVSVLLNEVSRLYESFVAGKPDLLTELPLQYAEYAVWQRKWVEEELLQEQAAYWKAALHGIPALLELPSDHIRPVQQSYDGGFVPLELDKDLTAGLKELSHRHGTTLYMTLLAGWGALLARLSGQEDIVIGTPTANRGRTEIEGLIGFFVNTLALRLSLKGQPCAGDLLDQVKGQVIAAQQNQDLPFEHVVEIVQPPISTSHSPIFQVVFAWQNVPTGELVLPEVESRPFQPVPVQTAKFDLTLSLKESGNSIAGGLEYASTLFEKKTVERYLYYFQALLQGMVHSENEPMGRLPLLGKEERHQVLYAWNQTEAAYPAGKCIHELFEDQAERTSSAVAVVYEDRELSYGELNSAANRLAHYLRRLGVKPDTRMAICLDRGLNFVIAELAILKAGGVYVPVDLGNPANRLTALISDSGATIVLSEKGIALPEILPAQRFDIDAIDLAEMLTENIAAELGAEALAYIIYTSGSTGQPKGVMVPHRAINRLVINSGYAKFNSEDRVAFASNPAFDASTMEVWGPLLNGGRIIVIGQDVLLDPQRFGKELKRQQVSILWLTVGLFNQYAEILKQEFFSLRHLIVGGDALDVQVIRNVIADRPRGSFTITNGYGPTETTTFALTHEIKSVKEKARSIPIGRPIGNTRAYILDEHGAAVPVGVKGELYIGGAGVARGYLNRGELTAERFVPDPYAGETGARMYKTGDVGRWLADGSIEFLGRNDGQIKIRGYRIELGEIEARMMEYGGIREAVVVAREDRGGEKRLVAYYVAEKGERGEEEGQVGAEQLRRHVAGCLPEYMVPAAYVGMESIPLTANGKLDRRSLPAPEEDAYAVRGYEEPRGEVERAVAEIWGEVLKVERVGRNDNFFALGGHSLMVVLVISRVQQRLGVKVGLKDLFLHPELGEFARVVASAGRGELPEISRVEPGGELPLSYAQQRLWFLHQLEPESSAYNITYALRLKGVLDARAVRNAITEIVRRHEVLRTTFAQSDAGPVQIVQPHTEVVMESDDLSQLPAREREAAMRDNVKREANQPFDLIHGPVMRVRILQLGAAEHVLVIVAHHIVSDGWSEHILLWEFTQLYTAFSSGDPSPLPERELQYSDFAVWQRKWLQGSLLAQQRDYWTTALRSTQSLKVPLDRRETAPTYAGGIARFQLTAESLQKIKELGRKQEATLFMVLTAVFHLLLGWYANQDDVITGTDVANRNLPEIEGMIGFFVNQLVLKTNLSGDPSFAELLQRVRTATLGAFSHQDFPFEKLVEELSPNRTADRNPLFNVKLVFQNTPPLDLRLPGLEVELLRVAPSVAKYLLLLTCTERDRTLQGSLEYERNLFEDGTIELLLLLFREILKAAVENPDLRISAIHEQLHALKDSHQHSQRTALQSKLQRNLVFTRRKDVSLA
jgi:amino acid adenylation domain-containing protein